MNLSEPQKNFQNLDITPCNLQGVCYITRMENNTYNGYYNRATWNLMLWIGNDEQAYHHFRALYMRIGGDDTYDRMDAIERECREWFGSTTPDRDSLDDVLWEEVREHLDDDNSDILDEFVEEHA